MRVHFDVESEVQAKHTQLLHLDLKVRNNEPMTKAKNINIPMIGARNSISHVWRSPAGIVFYMEPVLEVTIENNANHNNKNKDNDFLIFWPPCRGIDHIIARHT